MAILTFLAQEEGIEAEVVDTEVQPALAGYPALPAAARIVGDQLLRLREVEPGLKLHQGFSELLGLLLLLCQPAAGLLSDQCLRHRKVSLTQPVRLKQKEDREWEGQMGNSKRGQTDPKDTRTQPCLQTY